MLWLLKQIFDFTEHAALLGWIFSFAKQALFDEE
jgi:hypothetical protein